MKRRCWIVHSTVWFFVDFLFVSLIVPIWLVDRLWCDALIFFFVQFDEHSDAWTVLATLIARNVCDHDYSSWIRMKNITIGLRIVFFLSSSKRHSFLINIDNSYFNKWRIHFEECEEGKKQLGMFWTLSIFDRNEQWIDTDIFAMMKCAGRQLRSKGIPNKFLYFIYLNCVCACSVLFSVCGSDFNRLTIASVPFHKTHFYRKF